MHTEERKMAQSWARFAWTERGLIQVDMQWIVCEEYLHTKSTRAILVIEKLRGPRLAVACATQQDDLWRNGYERLRCATDID